MPKINRSQRGPTTHLLKNTTKHLKTAMCIENISFNDSKTRSNIIEEEWVSTTGTTSNNQLNKQIKVIDAFLNNLTEDEIKNKSEVEDEFTVVFYKKNKTKKLTKAAAA
ncbi:1963_t:CDS:2 [Cetraspora pellucida]|uniref:1963_t:CDS:1 n=1 Tax=Cetraspora pellucida TaxID=1433469 RepID=A0A9N9G6E2_9GLOM|nr:1963_t:CDS:2 [Cetraspora pellucida]